MSPLSFADARRAFASGADSPRAFLERCLAAIEKREPVVRAFAALNVERARAEADLSTERWRSGQGLSIVDGMTIGVKDLIFTADMPSADEQPRSSRAGSPGRDAGFGVVAAAGAAR